MGGRGSGSSIGGGNTAQGGERRNLSDAEIRQFSRAIDRKGFESVGNGHWELIAPGKVSEIGASILDETDSRAGGYGRMKAYSVQTWGQGVDAIGTTRIFGSLNAAKTAAKEEMKEWLKSYKIKP